MKKSSIFLMLIFNFICFYNFTQTEITNSFVKKRNEYASSKANKAELALSIKNQFINELQDSVYNFGCSIIEEGIEKYNLKLINVGKILLSSYYNEINKPNYALNNLIPIHSFFITGSDYVFLTEIENQIGVSFILKQNYSNAEKWIKKSIKSDVKSKSEIPALGTRLNLVEIYLRTNQIDKATELLKEIENTALELNLDKILSKVYVAYAKIYYSSNLNKTINYFYKSANISLKSKNTRELANAHTNLAIALYENEKYDQSLINFKKALELRLKINKPIQIAESYYNIGDWYYYQNQTDSALIYYKKSLDISIKNELQKETKDILKQISEVYTTKNDYKSAFKHLEEQLEVIEKLNASINNLDIAILEKEYELNIKFKESKNRNYHTRNSKLKIEIFILSIITIIAIVILLFFIKKKK